MSKHDDTVTMRQMLDYARQASELARGRRRSDLDTDFTFQLAMTRLVEIIGEAASRVSMLGREKYPHVPWLGIVGMRNRLIHGYDRVDLNLLWNTLDADIPALIVQLEEILGSLPADDLPR